MSTTEMLSALADIAAILGIPIFLFSYLSNQVAERKRAEYGTYDALDEKYVEFQRLAIQYPKLNVADKQIPNWDVALSAEDLLIRRTLYQILLAIFERAFLMYADQSDRVRKRQWDGWDGYIENFCRRPEFVEAFFDNSERRAGYTATFDLKFEAYLKGMIQQAEQERDL